MILFFSVPSEEILQFLRCFTKPSVLTYMKKVLNHFEGSNCSHNGDECFEVLSSLANEICEDLIIHFINTVKGEIFMRGLFSLILRNQ